MMQIDNSDLEIVTGGGGGDFFFFQKMLNFFFFYKYVLGEAEVV